MAQSPGITLTTKRLWALLTELPGVYTVERLASLCGASKAKVRESLLWLEDQGYIRITEEDE